MLTHLGSLVLLVTTLTACSSSSDGSGANPDLAGTGAGAGTANGNHSASGGSNSSVTGDASGGITASGSSATSADASASGGSSSSRVTGTLMGGSGFVSASSTRAVTSASGGTSLAGTSRSSAGGSTSSNGGSNQGTGGATPATSSAGAIECRREGDGKTTLVFVNACSQSLSYRGSDISGGTLAAGAFACVDIGSATETLSSKRYWAWAGTDPGAGRYTLAEFTFNTDFYDLDWYNISHVDAHNLPMAILPSARPKCRKMICPQDFLATCPAVGQYHDQAGSLVSCVSPDRDDPNNDVVKLFENCDDAYAWSGDDQNGTDTSPMIGCEVEDFDIVFCPEAT